jgi:membrane protein DedA with SNARE-associated domain
MFAAFIKTIIDWYMLHINYGTIALLMGMESTVIPFPSELIVPPAAWKAAQGELSIYGVIIAASLGALVGSLCNYFVARALGRPILYKLAGSKWARLLLVNEDHLQKAENYFKKYGKVSTFIGRLVPVIRHLISIPAGLSRMNLKQFCLFTFLGATLWNVTLTMLGVLLYNQKDQLEHYFHYVSYVLLAVGLLFFVYLVIKGVRWKTKVQSAKAEELSDKKKKNEVITDKVRD